MAGAAIGGIISLVPEIFKMVQSGEDNALAQQYLKKPRPAFRTPQEVWRAYKRYQMLSGQPLPGRGYMDEDIEEATSSGVRGLQELTRPTEAAAGAIGLYGGQQDQKRALAIEEAMLRRQGQTDLANFETGTIAPYREKEFDINLFQPYQEAQRAAAALLRSSEQNQYGALTGMSRIGTTLAGYDWGGTGSMKTGDTSTVNTDDFFGGNQTAADSDELRFSSNYNNNGLAFNHGVPSLPQDEAPYQYQPGMPGTVPFQYRKYPYYKTFIQ